MDLVRHPLPPARLSANLDMLRSSLRVVFRPPAEMGFEDLLLQLDRPSRSGS